MSNHGLNHGARYDVREKRSKEKIATDALRLQRREQRDIEEGRAVIGELEKRVVEAQKEKEQGKSTVGVGSEQVKKLTLELAEERRKVARLQVDLLNKRTQRDKEAARLIDVQEAPGRLRKSLESSHSSLGALLSSIEQRQTVLQQLIEGQNEALISLGMSEHAKRLTSDEVSLPLQAFQSSLDALLSKLSLAWSSNGGGGPKLSLSPSLLDDLGNLFPSNDDSPSSALGVTREAFGLAIPASAQLSTSGHDDSTTDTKRYLVTETGGQHDGGTDMLARAQEQLIEEQRRVATAQACLLAVKQGKSSPLSSRASQPRRQGQDLISLLHKTSKDLNKTIKQLRDEQSDFDAKIAERKERHELEDVQLAIARLEKQLAELEPGGEGKKGSQPVGSEKEQLKTLQKQLKEERKEVAELEAEIAEQVVAHERAETELVKLESAAKLVEEKEAELKEVQEELRSKEAALEDINGKIEILEGTLERLRTRAAGEKEDEHLAEGEVGKGEEGTATNSDAQARPSSSAVDSATYSIDFERTTALDAIEQELDQVQVRIEEETRKTDELEQELRDVQAEIERQNASADPSPSPTPHPSVSSASAAHSSFVAQRLLKIINESNKTVNTLREENMSLLMQIAGVAQ